MPQPVSSAVIAALCLSVVGGVAGCGDPQVNQTGSTSTATEQASGDFQSIDDLLAQKDAQALEKARELAKSGPKFGRLKVRRAGQVDLDERTFVVATGPMKWGGGQGTVDTRCTWEIEKGKSLLGGCGRLRSKDANKSPVSFGCSYQSKKDATCTAYLDGKVRNVKIDGKIVPQQYGIAFIRINLREAKADELTWETPEGPKTFGLKKSMGMFDDQARTTTVPSTK